MARITIVDSIMGSGKTSWAIQHIDEMPSDCKVIYITPYLAEVERVISSVKTRTFEQPSNDNREGRKLHGLKQLIARGANIVATHSLFKSADDELIDLLEESGYVLFLDEVMDVIEPVKISPKDITILLRSGYINIRENRVVWIADDYEEGRFHDIMMKAKAGNLYYHRDRFLIWSFPAHIFRGFKDAYVLTYLFEGQIQRYYFDANRLEYEYRAVSQVEGMYVLTYYDVRNEDRDTVMRLIDLYEGKLNDVGEMRSAFGANNLRNSDDKKVRQIKANQYNYLRNICNAKGSEIIWTTLQEMRQKFKGSGYAESFVEWNARATNQYAERYVMSYLFNRFMNPFERSFFEDRGVTINEDLLAVSDLLQWVWRSRIRNGQPIKLYLPSRRMRELLIKWSNYEL
ncbi:hypothetical protein [Brevibacillus laterosporus]|uniref:hypothetical protein n=1 Tax=Brevibacillus laterosporus TaxID=1465 RepID=UPI000839C428|nr:hypothetical protein [Brevibacillus laterosporus]